MRLIRGSGRRAASLDGREQGAGAFQYCRTLQPEIGNDLKCDSQLACLETFTCHTLPRSISLTLSLHCLLRPAMSSSLFFPTSSLFSPFQVILGTSPPLSGLPAEAKDPFCSSRVLKLERVLESNPPESL